MLTFEKRRGFSLIYKRAFEYIVLQNTSRRVCRSLVQGQEEKSGSMAEAAGFVHTRATRWSDESALAMP